MDESAEAAKEADAEMAKVDADTEAVRAAFEGTKKDHRIKNIVAISKRSPMKATPARMATTVPKIYQIRTSLTPARNV